jgi:hypothetical protein
MSEKEILINKLKIVDGKFVIESSDQQNKKQAHDFINKVFGNLVKSVIKEN